MAPFFLSVALTLPAPEKGVADALQPFVDRHTLAGAVVLVADREKVLTLDAVGYADVAARKPLRTDALFWIASQSKPITATAFMMLVDEGKVSLDDPVEKCLPEFKGQQLAVTEGGQKQLRAPRHPITVREILSHTSGLPFSTPKERPTLDRLPLRDAVKSYAEAELLFEPGSKYQYSNAGINTAGRIIEVISGMPYEEFLQKRLFGPLGMKDSTFWPSEEQLTRLAKSYKPNAAKTDLEETTITQLKYPLNDRSDRYPVPAGGLFSTATDVGRFCQMVLNGGELEGRRYLSEKAVREMTSRQTPEGVKENYGLGWATGGATFGHGGAYATNMTIDPKRGRVMVFLVQHAGFPGDGGQGLGAFQKAARERFGGPGR
jgi:CubicO group peptidase (beta-lactamase class C family)